MRATMTRLGEAAAVVRASPPTAILLALSLLGVAVLAPQPIRAILVVPVILIVPGLALLQAIGLADRRDAFQTIGLSVVLSMAVLALVTLGYWWIAGEVDPFRIAVVVAVLSLGPAIVGLQPLSIAAVPTEGSRGPGGFLRLGAIFVVGALMVAGLVKILPGTAPSRYSEAALDGSWANLAGFVQVQPGQVVKVAVQVTNHTGRRQSYRVEPVLDGATWTGATATIDDGATWRGEVVGTVPNGGCLHRLRIGVVPEAGDTLDGPTAWFATADPLPERCDVGQAS